MHIGVDNNIRFEINIQEQSALNPKGACQQ